MPDYDQIILDALRKGEELPSCLGTLEARMLDLEARGLVERGVNADGVVWAAC